MSTFGAIAKNFGLAMAGKNPWGGKSDGSDGPSGNGGGSDPDSGGNGKPKGPRNPWLPGSGGGDEPRRSANIEDIFKKRGPEGPRKGGGGPRGPNFQFPQRPGGKSWLPVAIGLVVLVGLGASMVHQVGPKEQATVKTFGQYADTLDPGIHLTLPWPASTVDIENVSEFRVIQVPSAGDKRLILTGDSHLVDLTYFIRWSISDLPQFKYQLADPIDTVTEVAEAAMRAAVAEKTLDETFSGAGRAEIELAVSNRMQAVLNMYSAGITIQGIEIDRADPPKEVEGAFKDVSVAEQNADSARNQARGFAEQILAAAEGETAAFDKVYEEYRLAPEVTRQRLYYETMERVLSKNDKTIVETSGVQTYLPLPEIRKRAQRTAPAVAAPEPTQPTTVEGQ